MTLSRQPGQIAPGGLTGYLRANERRAKRAAEAAAERRAQRVARGKTREWCSDIGTVALPSAGDYQVELKNGRRDGNPNVVV